MNFHLETETIDFYWEGSYAELISIVNQVPGVQALVEKLLKTVE